LKKAVFYAGRTEIPKYSIVKTAITVIIKKPQHSLVSREKASISEGHFQIGEKGKSEDL